MPVSQRTGQMDVSNTVDVSDAVAVHNAIRSILDARYPGFDFSPVDTLVQGFSCLYRGDFSGYRACDTAYHNTQHVLDVTLAMARLVDGHDRACAPQDMLGPEMALCGMAASLFHDAGYIRRCDDDSCSNGAAYTRVHVSRGVGFMSEYFPTVGLASLLPVCTRIVHFTGYEIEPDSIGVESTAEYTLGSLLGSADLIAQMSDTEYLDKCCGELYDEFVLAGIAGVDELEEYAGMIYKSPEHLLESTPDFIQSVIENRLDGCFKGVHQYVAEFFDGQNPYMDAIDGNRKKLANMLASMNV